jgi:hypothetical protein
MRQTLMTLKVRHLRPLQMSLMMTCCSMCSCRIESWLR